MRHHRTRKQPPQPPKRTEPLTGMFVLRSTTFDQPSNPPGPVLARIDGELYVMLFTNAARATDARDSLGVNGAQPFYICDANRAALVRELQATGARGFIVDYDALNATFSTAGEIPQA